MWLLLTGAGVALLGMLVAYGYGIVVGHAAGTRAGRTAADREWAVFIENVGV